MAEPKRLSWAQTEDLAQRLRDLLARIDAGELTATTAMTYRLQGALAALEAVLGQPSSLLEELLDQS